MALGGMDAPVGRVNKLIVGYIDQVFTNLWVGLSL